MKLNPYVIISSKFTGRDRNGNHTYEITFNQSIVHTGRWKGVEDGLNKYREEEIKQDEDSVIKAAQEIINRRNL